MTSIDISLFNSMQGQFKMILETPGLIEDALVMHRAWEPHLVNVISMFLKENGVFLDIGANIGYHSLNIASQRPDVTCIAFEPHPAIFKQLVRNNEVNQFKNVITYNLGVGNIFRSIDFYMQTENNYNRALSAIDYEVSMGEYTKERIQVIALDEFLADEIKKQISVIKIDTQGYEYQVLEGAKEIIKNCNPIVVFEFHPNLKHNLYEILSLLPHYNIFRIHPWTGEIRSIEQQDSEDFSNEFLCIPRTSSIPSQFEMKKQPITQPARRAKREDSKKLLDRKRNKNLNNIKYKRAAEFKKTLEKWKKRQKLNRIRFSRKNLKD